MFVAPATAAAGTASTSTTEVEGREASGTVISLDYQAGRQERNRLRIEVDARGATLTDRARIRAGRGCQRVPGTGRRQVRCRFRAVEGLDGGELDDLSVGVRLGARRDVGVVGGDFPGGGFLGTRSRVSLNGGPGPDRLRSTADVNSFVGGSGNDRMTGGAGIDTFSENRKRNGADTMRGGSSPRRGNLFGEGDSVDYGARRRGVVADLAGDRDDGARGERDRIGADVESLRAGGGSNRLTGNARANLLEGGDGRFDVIDGGRGRDRISTLARGGVLRLRDGENDSVSCATTRTRALADGYDEVRRCTSKRSEPVGLLVSTTSVFEEVRTVPGGTFLGVRLSSTCPPDARPGACSGRARLLGADGRMLGETTFEFQRSRADVPLELPVSEADRQRIRAAGEEQATLLLDMPGVPQRRYPLTLIAT